MRHLVLIVVVLGLAVFALGCGVLLGRVLSDPAQSIAAWGLVGIGLLVMIFAYGWRQPPIVVHAYQGDSVTEVRHARANGSAAADDSEGREK